MAGTGVATATVGAMLNGMPPGLARIRPVNRIDTKDPVTEAGTALTSSMTLLKVFAGLPNKCCAVRRPV